VETGAELRIGGILMSSRQPSGLFLAPILICAIIMCQSSSIMVRSRLIIMLPTCPAIIDILLRVAASLPLFLISHSTLVSINLQSRSDKDTCSGCGKVSLGSVCRGLGEGREVNGREHDEEAGRWSCRACSKPCFDNRPMTL
jgi:hypothetical protein